MTTNENLSGSETIGRRAIAHVVTWRLNGDTAKKRDQQARVLVKMFESWRCEFPGLLRMEVGRNIVDAADAWDVALYMVFETRAHLDQYQTHPAHMQIKALVGPMRMSRGQVDFEV